MLTKFTLTPDATNGQLWSDENNEYIPLVDKIRPEHVGQVIAINQNKAKYRYDGVYTCDLVVRVLAFYKVNGLSLALYELVGASNPAPPGTPWANKMIRYDNKRQQVLKNWLKAVNPYKRTKREKKRAKRRANKCATS